MEVPNEPKEVKIFMKSKLPPLKIKGPRVFEPQNVINILNELRDKNNLLTNKKEKLQLRFKMRNYQLTKLQKIPVKHKAKIENLANEIDRVNNKLLTLDIHLITKQNMINKLQNDHKIRNRQIKIMQKIKLELGSNFNNTEYIYQQNKLRYVELKHELHEKDYSREINDYTIKLNTLINKTKTKQTKKKNLIEEIESTYKKRKEKEQQLVKVNDRLKQVLEEEEKLNQDFKYLKAFYNNNDMLYKLIASSYYSEKRMQETDNPLFDNSLFIEDVKAQPKSFLQRELVGIKAFNEILVQGNNNIIKSKLGVDCLNVQKNSLHCSVLFQKSNNSLQQKEGDKLWKSSFHKKDSIGYSTISGNEMKLIFKHLKTEYLVKQSIKCFNMLNQTINHFKDKSNQLTAFKKNRLTAMSKLNKILSNIKKKEKVNKFFTNISDIQMKFDLDKTENNFIANKKDNKNRQKELFKNILVKKITRNNLKTEANETNDKHYNKHIHHLALTSEKENYYVKSKILTLNMKFRLLMQLINATVQLTSNFFVHISNLNNNMSLLVKNKNITELRLSMGKLIKKINKVDNANKENVFGIIKERFEYCDSSLMLILKNLLRNFKDQNYHYDITDLNEKIHTVIEDAVGMESYGLGNDFLTILNSLREIIKEDKNKEEVYSFILLVYDSLNRHNNKITDLCFEMIRKYFSVLKNKNKRDSKVYQKQSIQITYNKAETLAKAVNFRMKSSSRSKNRNFLTSSYSKRSKTTGITNLNSTMFVSKMVVPHKPKKQKIRIRTAKCTINKGLDSLNRNKLYKDCKGLSAKLKNIRRNYRNENFNFFRKRKKSIKVVETYSFDVLDDNKLDRQSFITSANYYL